MILCCTSNFYVIPFKLLHTPFNMFCVKGPGFFNIYFLLYLCSMELARAPTESPINGLSLLLLVHFLCFHFNLYTSFYCACNCLNIFSVSDSSFWLKRTHSKTIHCYWPKEHTSSRGVHWGGIWGYCIEAWVMYLSFQTLQITNLWIFGEAWLLLINSHLCMLHQSQNR